MLNVQQDCDKQVEVTGCDTLCKITLVNKILRNVTEIVKFTEVSVSFQ